MPDLTSLHIHLPPNQQNQQGYGKVIIVCVCGLKMIFLIHAPPLIDRYLGGIPLMHYLIKNLKLKLILYQPEPWLTM